MDQIELIIALVVFVGTSVGAVLYLRSEARANRQEWKAELAVVVASINSVKDDVAQLNQRVTALETKFDALNAKLDAKVEELSEQARRNHRELLIRLAFHHHGDGRYPVAPATDPDAGDTAGDDS